MLSNPFFQGCCLGLGITLSLGTPGFSETEMPVPESLLPSAVSTGLSPRQQNLLNPRTSVVNDSYLLGPGDQIQIHVIGYPEFEDTHVVLPDGTISLPLLGSVQTQGQTLTTLTLDIQEQLATSYLVNPVVDLSLLTLRPLMITVSGEVYRPGPLELNSVQENGTGPTLTSALAAAGGITNRADIRDVTVSRKQPNGRTELISLNLWDAVVSEPSENALLLRDGDSILIPQLSAEDTLDRTLLARSSVAPDTVRVRVVGEVNNPGEVELSPSSSLSSAVATAGGPTDDARLSQVAFIRMDETGEVISQTIDLRNLVDTHQVQDGDVLIVPKTGLGTGLDLFARFLGPFNFLFNSVFDINDNN